MTDKQHNSRSVFVERTWISKDSNYNMLFDDYLSKYYYTRPDFQIK